jgi:hypothetical protein
MGITPTSVAGRIQLLVGRLETLSDGGTLADGPFTQLASDLEAAQAALQEQNIVAARQALVGFTLHVQVFVSLGELSGDDGSLLVAETNAILGQL